MNDYIWIFLAIGTIGSIISVILTVRVARRRKKETVEALGWSCVIPFRTREQAQEAADTLWGPGAYVLPRVSTGEKFEDFVIVHREEKS